ncbi:histidine kinase [Paenibacillus filicis]|uniref:Histidine kinase n=1 Tax=Paenibacillus gyeongsangnamensis TaxID=3388067 RepID=A0ABT4QAK4_9BACL|nr:sensor histidine kinase [Paenibacillus filicis]MCZ8513875.1 histidine kinase [Paenibacillus filicis]
MQEISRSLDPLVVNKDFQAYMDLSKDDIPAQAGYEFNFRSTIQPVLQAHRELLGILYLDGLGKMSLESYQKNLNFDFSFVNDPFYSKIYQITNQQLTIPHAANYILGSPESVFSLVKPVINLRTGIVSSWLVIEIRAEEMNRLLNLSGNNQGNNLILYHPSSGTAITNTDPGSAVIHALRKALEPKHMPGEPILFESGKDEFQAVFVNIPYGEWKLVWMAPLSSISRGVDQSFRMTLMIEIASLVVALIVAFPIMNIVLRPLHQLKSGLQSLGMGKYVPIPRLDHTDEIGFLIKSYNQMLNELQRMEQEVYQSKLKEKEKELLQLQAQINPHFLFNTLETIESYAHMNNGNAVSDMVQSVSRIMRYNVRNDGGWAPLREELDYIRHFLNIHYFRHDIHVKIDFIIEEALLELSVMKLSIQPFVENSIKYGWSPSMEAKDFSLTVKAEAKENGTCIVIRDTGSGMPQDVLDKLTLLFESKGNSSEPFFLKHTGIFNVYRRFLLAYGDQTEIKIISVLNKGTEVSIYIPTAY